MPDCAILTASLHKGEHGSGRLGQAAACCRRVSLHQARSSPCWSSPKATNVSRGKPSALPWAPQQLRPPQPRRSPPCPAAAAGTWPAGPAGCGGGSAPGSPPAAAAAAGPRQPPRPRPRPPEPPAGRRRGAQGATPHASPRPLSTTPAGPLPPAPPWQQLPAALGLLARLGSALPCPQPGPQCQPLGRPPPRSILPPGCDRHGPNQSPLGPHQDCRYRVATPVTQAEAVLIGFVSAAGLCHTHRPWSALQNTNKETIRAGQGARAGQAARAGQEIRERGQER